MLDSIYGFALALDGEYYDLDGDEFLFNIRRSSNHCLAER